MPLPLRALRTASSRRAGRDRPRQPKPRLVCERLDDRVLPSFLSPVDYPAGAAPEALVTGDFNGDRKLDLATAGNNGSVSVLLGNGDDTFQAAKTTTVSSGTLSLAVGDFNKDGKLDVATANYSDVQVLLGNGDGTFQAPADIGIGSNPTSVAVGDFNHDGNMDLGVTSNLYVVDGPYYYNGYIYYSSHTEGQASVLLGNGSGAFGLPNVTDLGYAGYPGFNLATAVDINGDGFDDFVTANEYYGYYGYYGSVEVLLSDGSGFLVPASSNYVGDYFYSVAAGDLNGDGHADLVSANYYGANVGVLLGDGTGHFTSSGNFATGSNPMGVVLGDFTGDGKTDVVTANYWANTISLLYGSNDGALSAPISFATGLNPFLVAAGDFNGDGGLDAATANSGDGSVSVLMNDNSWPPAPPTFININDVTVTEGNTGSVNATFTVSLSVASSHDVTVHFATADGSATAGNDDYTAASGVLTIPAGHTSATVTIAVTGDRKAEDNENYFVNLSAPTNAFIGDGQGTGTILDNEPRVSVNDVSKTEGNGNGKTSNTQFVFTISLSMAYDQAVTVNYATADGTAKVSDNDYIATSGIVTFAPGETSKTVTVLVKPNKVKEPNEWFALNLTSASSNALLLDGQGLGWILDDDTHGKGKP